jgi:hypothetical protein
MAHYTETYKNNPELIKKLDKIKHLLLSIGGIEDRIDFEVDMNSISGEIYSLSIYISNDFEIDGLLEEFNEFFNGLDTKMHNIFKKIKLDEHLNLNRSYQNDYNGGMIEYLNFENRYGTLNYTIHFLLHI